MGNFYTDENGVLRNTDDDAEYEVKSGKIVKKKKKSATTSSSDIAPIDNRKWYQKGHFEDGYNFGDVTKTILGVEDKKTLKTFTAPETDLTLEELKQKRDYLAGRTWNTAEQSADLLKYTQQYNQMALYQYSDTLSKTQMDGQNHTVLEEIEILANMKSGKEKDKRKAAVLKKMEELGMDSSFYADFAGDGEFSWGAFGKWAENAAMAGLAGFNKGLMDTADVILGAPMKALGWEDNPFSEGAEYYGTVYDTYKYNANIYANELGGGAWNFGSEAIEGTTGALPNALLMFMTGGASATATTSSLTTQSAMQTGNWLTKTGLTVESMMKNPQYWMSFSRTLGSDYKEAKELGASDAAATVGSILKSMVNSGIEIGLDGGSGIQGLDDALKNGGKPFYEWVESSLEEGGEEMLQKFVGEAINKVGYGSDEEILNPIEYAKEGALGVISGAALGGGQTAVQSGVNAFNEHQQNKLTDFEKSVVDKLVEKAVSKKENATTEDKKKIRNEITENLKKGYISVDDIEEAIGGDDFTKFSTEKDNFFASDSFKEISDLDKRIKQSEKQLQELGEQQNTVANSKKYDSIQNRIDILTKRKNSIIESLKPEAMRINGIKQQMRANVFNQVKGTRLSESYNELARKSQKYEVDVEQYQGKAKETVQNIIDSGLGDNSNQFHELVDFLAKISNDKGVTFNFTKTELLKGTKHYKEGYITNGFVDDNGNVVLNKDSNNAIHTIVGHEVTHVLEKTDSYKTLQAAVRDYCIAKEGLAKYNARLKAAEEAYKGKKNTTPEGEVTADIIGEYLFTDSEFVNKLSTDDRSTFQKIYDEIKYLWKVATAGSHEKRELERVKKVFDKAWRENVKGKETKTEVTEKSSNTEATIDPENDSDLDYESPEKYSVSVTDPEMIEFLENQEHITTYKAMVLIDGKLYPPMASKVKGEDGKYHLSNGREIGEWMQAEEDTTNIKFNDKGIGYYDLKKDDGGTVRAAYNPYEHSSNLVLNDQFEAAYKRDNLVTVECVIPVSEIDAPYKAEYAKDSTGVMDWHSGVVAGKLSDNKRSVYLSRYLKATRILSDAEVAQKYKEIVGDLAVPFNVVSPGLLTELENVGVNIDYDGSPQYQYLQRRAAEREARKTLDSLANDILDAKSIQYSYSAIPSHKQSLDKNFDLGNASLDLETIHNRYDKIIGIWEKLGGELDSKFLNDWNNKVERPFTVFKAQAGYKYNVELSSMCKKGVPLFEAIDTIVKNEVMKELNTDVLGKEEKEILYDILKQHHFEIPCAICYVEQARQREGVIIDAFLNGKADNGGDVKLGWNQVLDSIQKEMKANGVDHNFAFVSRDIATDKYMPADLKMDEKTYAAFAEAVKKIANEEITRYNKESGKRRKLLKEVTPEAVKECFKGTLPSNLKIFKVLLTEPSSRFKIQDDLLYSSMTTKNLTMAHNALYGLFNSQGGVSGYKTKQAPTVYWGEILGKKWKPEATRKEGGIRNQSNSDFQMYTLLDQAQMYMDFSAKGYYLQAYTKVLSELKLFGLSRGKINASLIPKVKVYRNADGSVDVERTMANAGLDENGNLFFDDIEGINHKEAFMLLEDPEYSKNIGGICIGYSDNHIRKLLDDDRVQLIIGFHDKTNDPDKRYRGARYAKNYNGLNEAVNKDGKTVHIGFNPFVQKAEKKFQYNQETESFEGTVKYNGKTYTADDIPRLATDLYLESCAKKGYTPAYTDFSGHKNYYKLLADFSLYDSQGHYAPHQKVAYNMPDTVPYLDADGNKQYMDTEEYIKIELQKELAVRDALAEALADTSENGIIPQFKAEVNKRNIAPTRYSMTKDSEGNKLTEAQDEFFRDSVIRDENGSLMPMYHGTKKGGFTVFGGGKDYWYFTKDKKYADTFEGRREDGEYYPLVQEGIDEGYYTPQKYAVYLNVKNPFITDDIDVIEDALYWDKTLPEQLRKQGYDALMLEDMSQVIVLNPNQIKNMDNTNPSEDSDIRYSLTKDSEGKELTTEQAKFFKDSKVTDSEGNLKVVYHGSPADFNTFSLDYLGTNGTAEGYGFYFTDRKNVAEGYANSYEVEGGSAGKLFEVYLNIKKPLSDSKLTITKAQFKKFLTKLNGYVDSNGDRLDVLSNYGDVEWEGLNAVLNTALETEYDYCDSDVDLVQSIINGCGDMKAVFNVLRDTVGYDGIIVNEASWGGDQTIYIAFHPDQIKNTDNAQPTTNPDIRYSLTKDTQQEAYHNYLDAVNNGDTDTAQKLMDDFAKDAGYNYRGVHRSFSEFTVFDREKIGSNAGTRLGDGFYVTLEFKDDATQRYADSAYGENRMDLYVKMESPLVLGSPIDENIVNKMEEDFSEFGWFGDDSTSYYAVTPEKIKKIFQSNDGYEQMETIRLIANRNGMEISELLKQYGFDSVIDENDYVKQAVVFDESQLKSAEPITYDEYGDVIMPYERFDPNNMDIRFSLSPEGEEPGYGYVPSRDIGVNDEFAPIREGATVEDIAPDVGVAENETTTEEPSIAPDVDFKTTDEKLSEKLVNRQKELENIQRLRAENAQRYDEQIAKAQAELDSKKNKNTKAANRLKMRIERLQRLKADIDAKYAKRIKDITKSIDKTTEELEKDHTEKDRYTKAKERIDKILELDKAALRKEYAKKKAELEAKIADKDAYFSNMAKELYDELRGLRKGIRASENLGSLLDAGYDWGNLRSALSNVRYNPSSRVNESSVEESAVRQLINDAYENDVYSIDDLELEMIEKVGELETKAEEDKKNARRATQRRTKDEQYNTEIREMIGDTSTWVDLPIGLLYKTKTLRRILRTVVRDANGKPDIAKADQIYDYIETTYDHNEASLKKESIELKSPFENMRLTRAEDEYAQMLGEFRYNPETTLTEEMLKDYYEKHKKKIDPQKVDKAIEEARKLYDSLFERLNAALREQGFKEIPYRKGYFPHFTNPKQTWWMKALNWKPIDTEIPTSIAGLTETFKPQRSWQKFDKHRYSDQTDYSLYKGLDTYIHGALDWIYHIEDLQKRRALENYLRFIHSDEGIKAKIDEVKNSNLDAEEAQERIDSILKEAKNPLGGLVRELMNRTNTLANKKAADDRALEDKTNRKIYSTLTNLNNRVSANMVVGSLSSAMTNFIPMVQSWHEVSPVYTVKGLGDMIRSTIKDDGIVEKSDFLTNRLRNEENLYKTGWDKAIDKMGFLMEAVDNITAQTVWRSKYLQNLSEGMSENAAIKDADQFAKNVMAGRSRGNMPTAFDAKNPVNKLFTAFQLEVANQYGYMFDDVVKDSKTKTRLVKGYATAFLGAYAYNALYSALVGRDAAFDPIRIIEDLMRGLFDDEEEKEDVLLGFGEDILQEVPFVGGLLGGGRVPIQSALPYAGDSTPFVNMINDVTEGNWGSFAKEFLKPLYYLVLPAGGGQVKKTIEGLSMYAHPIDGSYTDSGNLRFPVEDHPLDVAQAALFGQYSSKNARDYFDNDWAPLADKQITEYSDLGMDFKQYHEIRDGLKDYDTLAEKVNYINSLDISDEQKNILVNNLTDRKTPIDMSSYGEYGDLEEYDFATKNPGKYAIAKVYGYDQYKAYTNNISNISGTKDSNGKTISGSRKAKVFQYINSLPLSREEKMLLFKSEYPADDSYNREILEWLDSMYSLDDIKTMLEELGFHVYNGTVTWD